jgi:hypothetical protein
MLDDLLMVFSSGGGASLDRAQPHRLATRRLARTASIQRAKRFQDVVDVDRSL